MIETVIDEAPRRTDRQALPTRDPLKGLPQAFVCLSKSLLPHTARALELYEDRPPQASLLCAHCEQERRELLREQTVAATAREGRVTACYEPCKRCTPWRWFRARLENLGIPPMQPICSVTRDHTGEVTSRKMWQSDDASFRHPKLHITGDATRATQQFALFSANGWWIANQTLETCADMGATYLLDQVANLENALAVVIGERDRGQYLSYVFSRSNKQRTWVIDPTGSAAPLVPNDFFHIEL